MRFHGHLMRFRRTALWATKSDGVGLIVRAISPRFPTYVVLTPDSSTSQTDRRTDDMQSQYRSLHYSASRGKNRHWLID